MRQDLTEIVVVLDRSGSMESCQSDAEGALNSFIKDQATKPGSANFTLVQFDHVYECPHKSVPIKNVPHCPLIPRGNTALNDSVARAIVETGERLKAMPEHERPGLVVFAILTDGLENASVEYSDLRGGREKIRKMIQHQSEVYKWHFHYLGANQDAFKEAQSYGIPTASAATYSTKEVKTAGGILSAKLAGMRSASAAGLSFNSIATAGAYTDAEREEMLGEEAKTTTSTK
jgi:hypothetical protein